MSVYRQMSLDSGVCRHPTFMSGVLLCGKLKCEYSHCDGFKCVVSIALLYAVKKNHTVFAQLRFLFYRSV